MDAAREWLFIASNVTVIIVGIKVVFALGEIKNQVDTMWEWFTKNMVVGQGFKNGH
jgi:hypothetical protein